MTEYTETYGDYFQRWIDWLWDNEDEIIDTKERDEDNQN